MDLKDKRAMMHIENSSMSHQVKINTKVKNGKDLIALGKGFMILALMVKYQRKLGCDDYPQYWTMFNRSVSLESGLPESTISQLLSTLHKAGFITRTSRGMYRLNDEIITLTK